MGLEGPRDRARAYAFLFRGLFLVKPRWASKGLKIVLVPIRFPYEACSWASLDEPR